MQALSTRSWLASAAISGAVAFAVILPTANATAAPAAAPTAAPAASSAGNTRGTSALTPEAQLAGRSSFGAKASGQQSLEAYWTPARMKAAIPAEQNKSLMSAQTRFEAKQADTVKAGAALKTNDGPQRSVAGGIGKGVQSTTAAAQKAGAFDYKSEDGLSADYYYNPNIPYYSPTAYNAGKVFFTMNGLNYVCSGTVVNSEGKDQVWTAGHCVHGGSGGSWAYNWTFVPAYDDDLANPRPYGTWSAAYLTSRSAWTNSSDFSQDMGVAVMNTNFGGWHIADYFGGQGFTVNKGKSGTWENAFGYTQYGGDDGGNLLSCYGSTSPEWDYWFTWSQTVQIPCSLNRGSSGGSWLFGWNGSWGYVNGINSRVDSYAAPTVMRSPYFDNDAWDLYSYNRYA